MCRIDAGADHIIEDAPPENFGHDPYERGAVGRAPHIRPDPREFVEVVPNDARTIVQSQVRCYPGRDSDGKGRVIVARRDGRGDDAELAPGPERAENEARPNLAAVLKPAFFLGAPKVHVLDDVSG